MLCEPQDFLRPRCLLKITQGCVYDSKRSKQTIQEASRRSKNCLIFGKICIRKDPEKVQETLEEILDQGSASNDLQAKFSPLLAFISRVLQKHCHLFLFYLWLPLYYNGRVK